VLLEAQDHITIEKMKTQLTTALAAGDIPGTMALYSDNAIILAPRRDVVRGQKIRRFWRNMSKQMKNLKFVPEDLEMLGTDTARESGVMNFDFGEASPEAITAKYVLVWQKAAGDWKVAVMAWSRAPKATDAAPAA
jgi:ketosteroid isomerase-like protein